MTRARSVLAADPNKTRLKPFPRSQILRFTPPQPSRFLPLSPADNLLRRSDLQLRPPGPTSRSDLRLRPSAPTFDSDLRLRPSTPTFDSDLRLRPLVRPSAPTVGSDLLVSQRAHRIDLRRAMRGMNPAASATSGQRHRRAGEDDRVAALELEQQRLRQPTEARPQPPDRRRRRSPPSHRPGAAPSRAPATARRRAPSAVRSRASAATPYRRARRTGRPPPAASPGRRTTPTAR